MGVSSRRGRSPFKPSEEFQRDRRSPPASLFSRQFDEDGNSRRRGDGSKSLTAVD